jgi:hypothetical protein
LSAAKAAGPDNITAKAAERRLRILSTRLLAQRHLQVIWTQVFNGSFGQAVT